MTWQVLGVHVSKHDLRALWRMVDEDMSGMIDFREFAYAIFPRFNWSPQDAEAEPQPQGVVTQPAEAPPTPRRGSLQGKSVGSAAAESGFSGG